MSRKIYLVATLPETPENATGPQPEKYKQEFPMGCVHHSTMFTEALNVFQGEGDILEPIDNADETIIRFMCGWAEQHQNDEEIAPDWEKQKPRELTAWDKANLEPIVKMPLINLLKAAGFIGCQLMLNCVATQVGQILVVKNEEEVQEYFGVRATFTKEDEEEVKRKYPVPFY